MGEQEDLSFVIDELIEPLLDYENIDTIKKHSDDGFKVYKNKDGEFIPYENSETIISGESDSDRKLKEKEIEKIIIMGVNKEACVKNTVREAKKRGYEIITSKDLMNQPNWENKFYNENTKYFEKTSKLIKYLKSSKNNHA